MSLTETPICNFGEKAKNFNLVSTKNKKISLKLFPITLRIYKTMISYSLHAQKAYQSIS